MAERSHPTGAGKWDHLVRELQALRLAAGEPSYAEIARRIGAERTAHGASEHAAHVARSTVHDAFRADRSRINVVLVREIVAALGGDPAMVDGWLQPAPETPAPAPPPRETAQPAAPRDVVLLMIGCVALSLMGRVVVDVLHLPLYLDMTGTAIAAVALGPWRGAAVGATTNVLGVAISGPISLPFALVNVAGALLWGYGVRRLGLGRTLARFLGLNVLVALTCTLIAVPILVANGGSVDQGQDMITETFRRFGEQLELAVLFSNSVTSLADKLITGFIALVAISALPAGLRAGVELALPTAPATSAT